MRVNRLPLVSIVTPSYNQAAYIEQTIQSVLNQDYPRIEYIIIDGGSTDGALDIIRRYEGRLTWVSEPDRGQSDAINKGFRRASGEIFAWLNSDDQYTPGAVRTAVEYLLEHPNAAFVYGDALAIDERGRSFGIRTHVKQTDYAELVNVIDPIVQPAAFWTAELWRSVGELDVDLPWTMDYEYWMRVSRKYTLHYIPVVLAVERLYGTAKSFRGAVERIEEMERIARRHGGDGLPANYVAEAAASYLSRALRRWGKGEWDRGVDDVRRALELRPPFGKFLRFFGVMTLFGGGALSWFWLRLNRLRAGRKRGVTFPA